MGCTHCLIPFSRKGPLFLSNGLETGIDIKTMNHELRIEPFYVIVVPGKYISDSPQAL